MLEDLLTQYFKPLKDYLPKDSESLSTPLLPLPRWQYRREVFMRDKIIENFERELKNFENKIEEDSSLFLAKLIVNINVNIQGFVFSKLKLEDQTKLLQLATQDPHAVSLLITLTIRDDSEICRNFAVRLLKEGEYQGSFFSLSSVQLRLSNHKSLRAITYIELSAGNFSRQTLSELNFSELDLHDANFCGATLTGLHLEMACLENANFEGATLKDAKCQGANFINAHLNNMRCKKTIFDWANFYNATLIGIKGTGCSMRHAYFDPNIDFIHADLKKANLIGADITADQLEEILDFEEITLSRSDFSDSDLQSLEKKGIIRDGDAAAPFLSQQERALKKWIINFKQNEMISFPNDNPGLQNLEGKERNQNKKVIIHDLPLSQVDQKGVVNRVFKIADVITRLVHSTSDTITYQSTRFEYSRTKKAIAKGKFFEYVCQEWRQPPIHYGQPESITIKKIVYFENPALLKRYQEAKTNIKSHAKAGENLLANIEWHQKLYGLPVLNQDVGEGWLFHGTNQEYIPNINQEGFDTKYVTKDFFSGYGALGKGICFSDAFPKAATYTKCPCCKQDQCKCPKENKPTKAMLLCRVLLGRVYIDPYKTRKFEEGVPDGYDSCWGPANVHTPESKFRCNEFLVSNVEQIYPEFCIYYQDNDPEVLLNYQRPDSPLLPPAKFCKDFIEREQPPDYIQPLVKYLICCYKDYYFLLNRSNDLLRRFDFLERLNLAREELTKNRPSRILSQGLQKLGNEIQAEFRSLGKNVSQFNGNNRYFKIQMDHFFYTIKSDPNQWSCLIGQYEKKQRDQLNSDIFLSINLAIAYCKLKNCKGMLNNFSTAWVLDKEAARQTFSLPWFISELHFIKEIIAFFKEEKVIEENESIKQFIVEYLSPEIVNYIIQGEVSTESGESYYWGLPSWDERENFYGEFKNKFAELQRRPSNSSQIEKLQVWIDELPFNATGARDSTQKRQQQWLTTVLEGISPLKEEPAKPWVKFECVDHTGQLHKRFLESKHVKVLFDEKGNPKLNRRKKHGRCLVIPLGNEADPVAYIKFYPQYPLRQFGADQFAYRFSGYGAVTVLAKLIHSKKPENAYPVLISLPLGNTLLEYRIKSNKQSPFPALDQKAFSWKLLETLLLQPEEDKDDNIALSFFNLEPNSARLISFDYDAYMPTNALQNKKTCINTIVYFLPNMQQTLDPDVIKAYLSLDLDQFLLDWWEVIVNYNKNIVGDKDNTLFNDNDASAYLKQQEKKYNSFCDLKNIFRVDDLPALHARMLCLKELLLSRAIWTGEDLFKAFESKLEIFYANAKNKTNKQMSKDQTELDKIYNYFIALPSNLVVVQDKTSPNQKSSSYSASRAIDSPTLWWMIGRNSNNFISVRGLEENVKSIKRFRDISTILEEIKNQNQNQNLKSFEEADAFIQQCVVNRFEWGIETNLQRGPLLKVIQNKKIAFQRLIIEGYEILTDRDLEMIAIQSRQNLKYVDVNKCTELTHNLFYYFVRYCKRLEVLHAEHLPKVIVIQDGIIQKLRFYALKRLYLHGSDNLHSISVPECMPELEILRIDECRKLISVKINAPKLQIVKANGCEALSDLQTKSQLLAELDIRGCDLLSEAKLSQIAQEVIHLNQVQLPSHLRHVSFRMQFPFLFDLALTVLDEDTIAEASKVLTNTCVQSGIDSSLQEFRRLAREDLLEELMLEKRFGRKRGHMDLLDKGMGLTSRLRSAWLQAVIYGVCKVPMDRCSKLRLRLQIVAAMEELLSENETPLGEDNVTINKILHDLDQLQTPIVHRRKFYHVLFWAIKHGNLELVKCLFLGNRTLLKEKRKNGDSVLHFAVICGQLKIIRWLVQQFKDLTMQKAKNGQTALHYAVNAGNFKIVQLLVLVSSELLTQKDNFGFNALHYAVINENLEIIELIREKFPDLIRLENFFIFRHFAVSLNNLEMVMLSIEIFPDLLQQTDYYGETPVHFAVRYGSLESVKNVVRDAWPHWLQNTKNGGNVLHSAISGGHLDIVKYIEKKFPDLLQQQNNDGETPLHTAAKKGNLEIFLYLEKKVGKVSPELLQQKNRWGRNLLHYAIEGKSFIIVSRVEKRFPHLLQQQDNDGETPLHTAAKKGNLEIFLYLEKKVEKVSPGLFQQKNRKGENLLHCAIFGRRLEICKHIGERFPHLIQQPKKYDYTPLYTAAHFSMRLSFEDVYCEIFLYLVEKASPDFSQQKDEKGRNLLHFVVARADLEMVKCLGKCFPDLLHQQDDKGRTPLHTAAGLDYLEIFKWLARQYPPSLLYLNLKGQLALNVAIKKRCLETARWLVKRSLCWLQEKEIQILSYPTGKEGKIKKCHIEKILYFHALKIKINTPVINYIYNYGVLHFSYRNESADLMYTLLRKGNCFTRQDSKYICNIIFNKIRQMLCVLSHGKIYHFTIWYTHLLLPSLFGEIANLKTSLDVYNSNEIWVAAIQDEEVKKVSFLFYAGQKASGNDKLECKNEQNLAKVHIPSLILSANTLAFFRISAGSKISLSNSDKNSLNQISQRS